MLAADATALGAVEVGAAAVGEVQAVGRAKVGDVLAARPSKLWPVFESHELLLIIRVMGRGISRDDALIALARAGWSFEGAIDLLATVEVSSVGISTGPVEQQSPVRHTAASPPAPTATPDSQLRLHERGRRLWMHGCSGCILCRDVPHGVPPPGSDVPPHMRRRTPTPTAEVADQPAAGPRRCSCGRSLGREDVNRCCRYCPQGHAPWCENRWQNERRAEQWRVRHLITRRESSPSDYDYEPAYPEFSEVETE